MPSPDPETRALPAPADPDATRALALWQALHVCHTAFARRVERELALAGLTRPQWEVLERLYDEGPCPLNALGAALGVSAANVSVVVRNLEKAGLVTRSRPEGDRRIFMAALTEAGRARVAALQPAHGAWLAALAGGMTPDEQEILTRLIRKLGRGARD